MLKLKIPISGVKGDGIKKRSLMGITLIELITVIVVLSVAIPVLLTSWASIAWKATRSETIADTSFYAEQLMEEVKSRRFDDVTRRPFTNSASFGVESGESLSNSLTYDDIDDFVGSTDTNITTPATGYVASVAVEYVNMVSNAWASCGSVTCSGTGTNCTLCNCCCFKKVTVSVRNTGNYTNTSLTTIISSY